MSTETLQVRVDSDLKDQVISIFREIGVDIPTAVRMFFKAVVRERRIPFELGVGEEKKAQLIGTVMEFPDRKIAKGVQHALTENGYTVYLNGPRGEDCHLWIADYLPPATRNSDGFFIENDALAARIRRELRQDPYNRQDDSIFPLLINEQQRGSNEDVIGFIPGVKKDHGYQAGYMYLPSEVLWYSNLQRSIEMVIRDFDIYGFDYPVTWQQWREIKAIADQHGVYSSGVAAEIDNWLQRVSDSADPAMTIMCI